MTHDELVDKVNAAELDLRERLPGLGIILIVARNLEDGFALHSAANMPIDAVRTVLGAALADVMRSMEPPGAPLQ